MQHLYLQMDHWKAMRDEVIAHLPLEACGLVGGRDRQSLEVFPITNELRSPYRFRMNPHEQLRVFKILDVKEWDLLAIYHSHPQGPPHPSPTDIAESAYPEAYQLIWSPTGGNWACRAFLIEEKTFLEERIEILDHQPLSP